MTRNEIEIVTYLYTVIGLSSREIARIINKGKTTILRYLSAAGVDTSIPASVDNATVLKWVRLFNKGASSRHIASIYGISHNTVLKYLRRHGINTSTCVHGTGIVYCITYKGNIIYIGSTVHTLPHRLAGHLAKASERIGAFGKFLDDNMSKDFLAELDILPIEEDIPTDVLVSKEYQYIREYATTTNLLNVLGVNK